MKVLADISLVPIGVGASLSAYVAACERVLDEAGLARRACTRSAPTWKGNGTR